jgi:uncharacterized membrane protein YkvA (DUF1232 family)
MRRWREQAHRLRRDVYTLSLACHDPRVPWYVKALAAGLMAYALSPIDLIPDFIPVLGYLDDLVVIPLGILLMRRWIPVAVWADCQARAEIMTAQPISWVGAAIVVGLWLLLAGFAAWLIRASVAL